VAKEIELEDKFENMGAQMVKEVASKTSDVAGDGTTTATVLAQAIYREGLKMVTAGHNPMDLKRGIDRRRGRRSELKKLSPSQGRGRSPRSARSRPTATRSIGKSSPRRWSKVGKEGVITVEEGKSLDTTELDVVEGMQFDRGYLSPYFVTDPERMEVRARRPLHPDPREEDLEHEGPAAGARAGGQAGKPLLIIAEDVEGEALATLVVNKLRGTLKVAAVKAPGFGDRRKAMLRTSPSSPAARPSPRTSASSSRSVQLSDLGTAKRVTIDKDNTTIVDGGGKKGDIRAASSRSASRSRRPPRTTTARSCRSAWPSSPAAWR
jgi:chaperonin GroEL